MLDHMATLLLGFYRISTYWFPEWLHQFTFPQEVLEGSLFSTSSLAFIIGRLFNDGHSDWCEVVPHYSFDLHFSNNDDEHLFMCLLAPICLLWRNVCLDLLPIFSVGLFVFLLLNCLSCLCSLDIKPLLVASFAAFIIHRLFNDGHSY